MRKFHYAIKAIDDEILRHIGKVARKYVEHRINPTIAVSELKVKRLKESIKILEQHPDNKHV